MLKRDLPGHCRKDRFRCKMLDAGLFCHFNLQQLLAFHLVLSGLHEAFASAIVFIAVSSYLAAVKMEISLT